MSYPGFIRLQDMGRGDLGSPGFSELWYDSTRCVVSLGNQKVVGMGHGVLPHLGN